MSAPRSTASRVRAREHGRERIRIATRRIAAASVAGCAAFAGLAATHGKPAAATTTTAAAQPTITASSPTVTVTQTQSTPVTVSGGS